MQLRNIVGRACALALIVCCLTGSASAAPPISIAPAPGNPGTIPQGPLGNAAPQPSAPVGQLVTGVKYRVLAVFPNPFFCDLGRFPVAVAGDELTLARHQLNQLQADPGQLRAILEHNGLVGERPLSDAEVLKIYSDYKRLRAIDLTPAGRGYRFELRVSERKGQGFIVTGVVDAEGAVSVKERRSGLVSCPVCLSPQTRIETPRGPVQISDLKEGDPVWTADFGGERQPATVERLQRVSVPPGHQMVHLRLADGRALLASPGHPTADGRRVADLRAGDLLDGSRIVEVREGSAPDNATYDILPSGPTGRYWADGILMGSILMDRQVPK
jgi:hypothetical protein